MDPPPPPTTSSAYQYYNEQPPPPSAMLSAGAGGENLVMDELGTVTRRIATLKLELEILAEQHDPDSVRALLNKDTVACCSSPLVPFMTSEFSAARWL